MEKLNAQFHGCEVERHSDAIRVRRPVVLLLVARRLSHAQFPKAESYRPECEVMTYVAPRLGGLGLFHYLFHWFNWVFLCGLKI
jgi:hypothetical protein